MAHKDQGRNSKGQFTSKENEEPTVRWNIDTDGDGVPEIWARGKGIAGIIAVIILGVIAFDMFLNNGQMTATVVEWVLSKL